MEILAMCETNAYQILNREAVKNGSEVTMEILAMCEMNSYLILNREAIKNGSEARKLLRKSYLASNYPKKEKNIVR